jgi:hypothetical protein
VCLGDSWLTVNRDREYYIATLAREREKKSDQPLGTIKILSKNENESGKYRTRKNQRRPQVITRPSLKGEEKGQESLLVLWWSWERDKIQDDTIFG